MSESKIQIRAQILQEIAQLRAIPAVCDSDIEKCIEKLSKIEDKQFLCSILLKEINGCLEYFDGVLAILAINLAKQFLEKTVLSFLEKSDTTEQKKLFLINLLKQAGFGINTDLIHLYIKNPDELIDYQTEKLLKLAEVNPEAQIDFLDFYFGINPEDRLPLLSTIINDYSGDMLANIITPLIYSLNDYDALKVCIDGLCKSKSYLAFSPLEWLIKSSNDKRVVSLAKKTKNELKIAGLRKNVTLLDYYKNIFQTSKPYNVFVSVIDGMSNFSYVFSRLYDDGTIFAFFAVMNLDYGAVSCFGLSNISQSEYEEVLKRFFRDSEKIPLDFSFAKSLLDELSNLALENNLKLPYEFLCWRQLTYDIKGLDVSTNEFISSKFKIKNIDKSFVDTAMECDFCEKWFFSYSRTYPEFIDLIDEICTLNEKEFENFDEITNNFLISKKSLSLYNSIKKRFLYEAYFLFVLGFKNLSLLFYSLHSKEELIFECFKLSIQKSIYEFFLSLNSIQEHTDKTNIFAKQRRIKYFDFNAKLMLQLIEKKWIS